MNIIKELNLSLAYAAGVTAWADHWVYQVPSRSQMLLTHFSNYMAVADWGEVTWRILRNGVPVPPYETILDQVGISTQPRLTEPVLFEGGDYCQIQIMTTAASVLNDIGIAVVYELKG